MSVVPNLGEDVILTIKLLLLGESSVGKSSIVNRYTNHSFQGTGTLLTIGVEVRKIMKQLLGRKVRLQLWDTSGQERFRTIPANYFRGVQGIMLVYDITSGESFSRVEEWLERIDQNCHKDNLILTLVGNKLDLDPKREVSSKAAIDFASSHSMKFRQTSAKTAQGVEDTIEELVRDIMAKGGIEGKKQTGFKLDSTLEKKAEQKDSCC